jgi:hypothetical protein
MDPAKTEAAVLKGVHEDFFIVSHGSMEVNIPYKQIIKVFTSPSEQISTGFFGFGGNFPLVIRVFDFVIYKGAVGVSIPIGEN